MGAVHNDGYQDDGLQFLRDQFPAAQTSVGTYCFIEPRGPGVCLHEGIYDAEQVFKSTVGWSPVLVYFQGKIGGENFWGSCAPKDLNDTGFLRSLERASWPMMMETSQ